MIQVTKSYLPCKKKYSNYIDNIFSSGILTNRGPYVQELEKRLEKRLRVPHVICVSNGTLALQVAYRALGLTGEVITTPFSFSATTSTIKWENLKPIFVDIDNKSFNIDASKIEEKINEQTSAIVPVHVYGNPCEVEIIERIAKRNDLKVIYDAAHAFDIDYKSESLLSHGDISTISFHATKIFHTVEGGALVTSCDILAKKIRALISFGSVDNVNFEQFGTNAKMNEFQAAMGLCVLDDFDKIKSRRQELIRLYKNQLGDSCQFQSVNENSSELASYMPIVLKNEKQLHKVIENLNHAGINPRRYFFPSLEKVYNNSITCLIADSISRRVLCLPLMYDLENHEVNSICQVIRESK